MVTAPHHLISFGYLLAVKYLCKANCQRNSWICVGSSWCQCFDPVDHCRRLETVIDTLRVSNWIKLHRWRILCTCWWMFIQELQTELWCSTGSDLGPVILTFTGCNFVMSSGDTEWVHTITLMMLLCLLMTQSQSDLSASYILNPGWLQTSSNSLRMWRHRLLLSSPAGLLTAVLLILVFQRNTCHCSSCFKNQVHILNYTNVIVSAVRVIFKILLLVFNTQEFGTFSSFRFTFMLRALQSPLVLSEETVDHLLFIMLHFISLYFWCIYYFLCLFPFHYISCILSSLVMLFIISF